MQRHAFKMKLKPGFEEEYKKRHDEIWPELKQLLAKAGIRDYSIFLDKETHALFAFHKMDEGYDDEEISDHPIMQKWWEHMKDIMETNPDHSPVTTPLKEVFHMD